MIAQIDLQALTNHGASFDWLKTDHMPHEAAKIMYKAAMLCDEFSPRGRGQEPRCLILSSAPPQTASEYTGYGVGKSKLASVVHALNSRIYQIDGGWKFERLGKFMSSAELLSQFDTADFNLDGFVKSCFNLLIVDDVGREGAMRFESRDMQAQAIAVRDRYYKIIEGCLGHRVSLMLTTNFTSSELINHIGGAAWSRLNRMRMKAINMQGIPEYNYREEGSKNGS